MDIFAYPDLEPHQKREFELTIDPFDLSLAELTHLLATPFPFEYWTKHWLERFVELSQLYSSQQGPPDLETDSVMYEWARKQRIARNRGQMPLDRERALNRIGFIWNPLEAKWQKQYEELLAYQTDPEAKMSEALSTWLSNMRKRWDLLTPHQEELLKLAGQFRKPNAVKWQKQYEEYVAYQKNPQAKMPGRVKSWLIIANRNWNGLTPLQKRLLREVGFIRSVEKNQDRYKDLVEKVEAVYARDGLQVLNVKMQRIVGSLRHHYQRGLLNAELKTRCDRMGLQWIRLAKKSLWERRYAQAKALVSSRCKDPVLERWLRHQRLHWEGLSEEQRKALQSIGLEPPKGQ